MRVEAAPQAVQQRKAEALKAAKGFEAVFLKEMFKAAMPSGDRGLEVYGDCLAGAMADEAAKGRGLGLADWIAENGLKSAEEKRIT